VSFRSNGHLIVFAGSSNLELATEIAGDLGLELGERKLSRFSDGEVYARFLESVRGKDAFIVQSLSRPVNDHLVELLVMVDALKRASTKRISAVIPYYGYSRQDKKAAAREPITAKLIADLLTVAGIDRMLSMDLHAGQIQGFFNKPVDHLTALSILSNYFKEKKLKDLVVVAPDVGRVKMANSYANRLGAGLAILHKTRPSHNRAEISTRIVGEVKDKIALLIDDMIDTGGTIVGGAEVLLKGGAREVYACATHPVFSDDAVWKLQNSAFKEVVVTNSIHVPNEKRFGKLKILSVANLFARAIDNIHNDGSVSSLFKGENF